METELAKSNASSGDLGLLQKIKLEICAPRRKERNNEHRGIIGVINDMFRELPFINPFGPGIIPEPGYRGIRATLFAPILWDIERECGRQIIEYNPEKSVVAFYSQVRMRGYTRIGYYELTPHGAVCRSTGYTDGIESVLDHSWAAERCNQMREMVVSRDPRFKNLTVFAT
jgi:hypothetical protein